MKTRYALLTFMVGLGVAQLVAPNYPGAQTIAHNQSVQVPLPVPRPHNLGAHHPRHHHKHKCKCTCSH